MNESHVCTPNWLLSISISFEVVNRCQLTDILDFNMSETELRSFLSKLGPSSVFLNKRKNFSCPEHSGHKLWSHIFFLLYPTSSPSASPVCSTFKIHPASRISHPALVQGTSIPRLGYCSSLRTRLPDPTATPLPFSTQQSQDSSRT